MFVDEVTIEVYAGNGGSGCTAFRREKFVPMGGPYGGNGGHGQDIIFIADEGLNTLLDLRYQRIIKALPGEGGRGKMQDGKSMDPLVIKVPVGTIVTDLDTNLVIADLSKHGQKEIVAKGGRGGRGNVSLKTRANPAPDYSENGEEGEHLHLKVELKLLADCGLVGLPSVGKSTIISCVSKSKPKIAAYHFTTLTPNLGVCRATNSKTFVMADLPGLIEGASNGAGLGDKFLKHIERTRVIAHVVDMSRAEGRDPYEDYILIRNELGAFNKKLLNKPEIIIANKMDAPEAKEYLEDFKKHLPDKEIFEVSAATNKGLQKVVDKISEMLEKIEIEPVVDDDQIESHILYKFKEEKPFEILKDDDGTWVVAGKQVEKLFKLTKFTSDEAINRFARKLRKMGIDDELRKRGAQENDAVRILDFYFEFKD